MAKRGAPHRHHYIPRMILRNFVNAEDGLFFWRREFNIGDVKMTTPENLFLEDNLYTLVGDNGERDVSIEKWFAKMESVGARLIADLLAIVRSGRTPRFSADTWEFLLHFHYYSGKRSSAWHNRFVSRDEVLAVAKAISQEPGWTDADRAELLDTPDLDRVMNNARIAAQCTPPPDDLLDVMRSRGMAIYVAPSRASFILGDHPTASTKGRTATGGNTSFMPISYDVAIGYINRPRAVHVEYLTRPQIRRMNEAMARQSVMIAGRSDALVRSLSKLGYETPKYFTTLDYLTG